MSVRKEHRKRVHPHQHQVYPAAALTFLGSQFYRHVCADVLRSEPLLGMGSVSFDFLFAFLGNNAPILL